MNSFKLRVNTLCFKNKFIVPHKITGEDNATVADVRAWIAEKLHFPVEEAQLIACGRKLTDKESVASLADAGVADVYLVCKSPATGGASIRIYVKDTTRVPNKMYAVKMEAGQTVAEMKSKLYKKSTCKVLPDDQQLTVRGKVVDDTFSLREYTISQRKDRIVFYLSKKVKAGSEEMKIKIVVPSSNARFKSDFRADQTVLNIRQMLQTSHGVDPEKFSLLNAAGLVLRDGMTLREACTMPLTEGASVPKTKLTLFAVPLPRDTLAPGLEGFHVFLNPEHHAALGLVDPESPSTPTTRVKRKKTSSKPCESKKGSKMFKGFRGMFAKKTSPGPAEKSSVPKKKIKSKATKTAKKSARTSYKNRMKEMLRSSRFVSDEDKVAKYREKIAQSVGGGAFKRIESI
eukprot:CAMPEP_0195529532 /NCGR_PEP_ID=MMETSP0794_2-20130614/32123_1 /TAXON_ID=515487 /ORGANISM="Stephanopyxis turris, Strain CCMP 815" /LENGTH=401 /DNA_ID=CAMNT_0040660853 /DNA_START=136 /DNA_END=1341 /DNA_ORIENTATION=+